MAPPSTFDRYTIVLHFDQNDAQTRSIIDTVFDPLCSKFHVAIFSKVVIWRVKDLYETMKTVTSGQAPLEIVPAQGAFRHDNDGRHIYFGVSMDREGVLDGLREALMQFPDLQDHCKDERQWRAHASLKCKDREDYYERIDAWREKFGPDSNSPFEYRLRVTGLDVMQTFKKSKVCRFFRFVGSSEGRGSPAPAGVPKIEGELNTRLSSRSERRGLNVPT